MKKLVIISPKIRKDIQHYLQYFEMFDVYHFYNDASFGDMQENDFNDKTIHYSGFVDLWSKLREVSPDIVQGSEPYWFPRAFYACLVALIYCWWYNKKLFFPVFELNDPRKNFGQIIGNVLILFMRLLAHKAAFIIVISERTRNLLISNGVNKNKIVKYLWGNIIGIDLKTFSPQKNGDKIDFGSENTIIFVGNLLPIKGIDVLLEAFIIIKKQIKDAKLIIIGKGILEERIKQFIKINNLNDDIVLTGQVKNSLLPSYYSSCKVSVLPSIKMNRSEEQIGFVNILSLACGTPVVTTDCGGIPEFIIDNENALIVPQNSSRELAEAIIKILKDEDLRTKMANNGRAFCEANYNVKLNVKKVENYLIEKFTVET
jgi:glycosyltransferase involved in cell wall biosynthesis